VKRVKRGLSGFLVVLLSPLMVVLVWPLLVWSGAGVGLYQWRKDARLRKSAPAGAACALDTDCPPGYVCVSGHCVPAQS
jgi:hypothetical protein